MELTLRIIVGVVLHALAIFAGAKLANVGRVDFLRAAMVALLSYIAILLALVVLWPLNWVPLINLFVSSLALGLGTMVTARLLLDCRWQPAAIIGATAMVVGALAGLFYTPFM